MQSRKQLQRVPGHHPNTLVLLGTEPYTIFLIATRYQLSSTSHKFPKAWDLLNIEVVYESILQRMMQKENDSFPSGESDVLGGLSGRYKYPVAFWNIHKYAALSSMCQQPRNHWPTTILGPSWKHNKFKLRPLPHLCVLRFQVSILPYIIVLGHCLKYKSLHPSIILIHLCSCCYWFFFSPDPTSSCYSSTSRTFPPASSCFYLPNIPSSTPSGNRFTLSIRKSMWLRWATKSTQKWSSNQASLV